MDVALTTTILILALCYTVYHSIVAYREYRENRWRRSHGTPYQQASTEADAVPLQQSASGDSLARSVAAEPSLSAELATAEPAEHRSAVLLSSVSHVAPRLSDQPVISSYSKDRVLFSANHGVVNGSVDSGLVAPPLPEELPIPDDDLVFGPATPAIAQLLPESRRRRELQRKDLIAAGYHSRAAWLNLNAIRFLLAFTVLVVVGFWLLTAPPQLEPLLLGLVVLGPLLMWALPPLIVGSKASERRVDIERGLPDVLDMLNMGVSQGLTVPASLKRIGPEISSVHPALSQELKIINQQAHVSSLSDALRSFSSRIDSAEVSSFTSLLLQSETTGTSISRALADYSDSMRSSLRERADSRANAASFKLLFPTALCLMPSVFLFLLGPAIVEMTNFFENTAGSILSTRSDAIESLEQRPVAVPLNDN